MANANETKPTNAAAAKKADEKALMKANQDKFVALVHSEKLQEQMLSTVYDNDKETVRRIGSLVLNAAMKSPALYRSTPASVMKVLTDCCSLGIEPNGRDAHVVPYKRWDKDKREYIFEAQLIIDYKGYNTLAMKSERVSGIRPETVCKNDIFSWKNGVITHEVDFFSDRGDIIGAYAVAKMKDGTELSTVMSKKEIDEIRNESNSSKSPAWENHYGEMAKKTAVRRLAKMLPLSPAAIAVIAYDDSENFNFDQQPTANTAARKQSADALFGVLADTAKAADAMDDDADTVTVEAEVVE